MINSFIAITGKAPEKALKKFQSICLGLFCVLLFAIAQPSFASDSFKSSCGKLFLGQAFSQTSYNKHFSQLSKLDSTSLRIMILTDLKSNKILSVEEIAAYSDALTQTTYFKNHFDILQTGRIKGTGLLGIPRHLLFTTIKYFKKSKAPPSYSYDLTYFGKRLKLKENLDQETEGFIRSAITLGEAMHNLQVERQSSLMFMVKNCMSTDVCRPAKRANRLSQEQTAAYDHSYEQLELLTQRLNATAPQNLLQVKDQSLRPFLFDLPWLIFPRANPSKDSKQLNQTDYSAMRTNERWQPKSASEFHWSTRLGAAIKKKMGFEPTYVQPKQLQQKRQMLKFMGRWTNQIFWRSVLLTSTLALTQAIPHAIEAFEARDLYMRQAELILEKYNNNSKADEIKAQQEKNDLLFEFYQNDVFVLEQEMKSNPSPTTQKKLNRARINRDRYNP